MFFIASKIVWFFAEPSNFLILLLVIGTGLLWSGAFRLARLTTTVAAGSLVMVVLLPVGKWLLLPLENRFDAPAELPVDVDGVVVLGGAAEPDISAARDQPSYNEAGERISALIELGRRYPTARLVFTGGIGDPLGAPVTAAGVARDFYRRQGFDVDRILFEDGARNTFENATLSKQLAGPQPDEHWLLVTSARHMPRAVGTFRRSGWAVTPYPVDYRTTGRLELAFEFDVAGRLSDLDLATKEWVGLAAYHLTGRTDSLFPGDEGLASRRKRQGMSTSDGE